MAELVKDFWTGMPFGLYLILILAIGIGVAGFCVPPMGVISGSVLKFIALILGASWLFYVTANIPTILASGAKIRAEYKGAKFEIGRHKKEKDYDKADYFESGTWEEHAGQEESGRDSDGMGIQ